MVFQNDILAGSSGASGASSVYQIDQSIRFNPADSTYMSRAVGSGGNTKTWTFSCWFKIGVLGSKRSVSPFLWSCHQSDANRLQLSFDSGSLGVAGDHLSIYDGASASTIFRTNRVFRDPSAWYNLILISDTSNSIANERFRVYVNGQRETSFSTFNAPSLNADLGWNQNGSTYYLGSYFASQGTYAFDGYIAEMVHIDGTALDPSNFAETNSNGIWIPKDVSGLTFGTKGFYIDGRDSSDLGDDESGQGNDFTTSGLASHDQMVGESPTNNFAIANPLDSSYYMGSETFSEGNLQMTLGSSVGGLASMGITSGKWYAEFEVHSGSTTYFILGIYGDQPTSTQHYVGQSANSYGYYANTGQSYNNASASSYGNSYTVSDVIGVAVDLDNNKLYFSKNGTFQNSGDPTSGATGTGAISINPVSSTGLGAYFIASSSASSTPSSHTINYNFGQDGTFAGNVTAGGNADGNGVGNFKNSVPSGYLALCTKNLGS